MTRRMLRYEVPVDGHSHVFDLTSDPIHAETTSNGMEFWAEHDDTRAGQLRHFQVFGTGYELAPDARWIATGGRTPDGHVGHLYERWPT